MIGRAFRREPDFPIDVVIVNYRTGPLVVDCLASLDAERRSGALLRAIVVDNDSRDGSAQLLQAAIIREGWDWAQVVCSPVNGGFGSGCNLGIEHALRGGEAQEEPCGAVWLLNPDTRVMPGAAHALATFMAATPRAGIVGTALLQADGAPWPYAFRFPTVLGELERALRWGTASRLLASHATARRMDGRAEQADWVSGASMAIRRDALQGGLRFDEDYFLYYEETDFCRSARAQGWQCWYAPRPTVLHVAGQSTGVTGKDAHARRVPGYWFASRRRYFRKNHGWAYAFAADLAWVAGHCVHLLKQRLRRAPREDPPRLLSDFVWFGMLAPQRR
ncbi:glycosyltransferase family 2 protein [Novosphingobium guangzhouense]|uniref:Glycosyl transferase family 2 n=1 Tax=Novosphingobium guangzhouense TaxID=1850347 RepID=A0A2K2G002_9SPHN|nr:glycosyltransferase family 2 protein [Novosphingobium guangzhouense]PNU04328.1 glycosyl transferase family 2 [Novosphingobium guangzhouense]